MFTKVIKIIVQDKAVKNKWLQAKVKCGKYVIILWERFSDVITCMKRFWIQKYIETIVCGKGCSIM